MPNKAQRWEQIREVIQNSEIESQQALLSRLRKRGHSVNQSTLSRDLRELGVRKSAGRYRVPPLPGEASPANDVEGEPSLDISPAVEGWTACGPHLLVLHTKTGQAQAIGVELDGKNEPALAGTLAGDDTLFLATKNRQQQAVLLRRLTQWFGDRDET